MYKQLVYTITFKWKLINILLLNKFRDSRVAEKQYIYFFKDILTIFRYSSLTIL